MKKAHTFLSKHDSRMQDNNFGKSFQSKKAAQAGKDLSLKNKVNELKALKSKKQV